ncbi:uncharacterized protein LOC135110652 isoform X2 [Scylla paramamosain]|uniref:uncharacterized protein LOC135110652 isoform X2 n=1 Tax=Scylla paramamosain TaxID=85552 RepID=UPI003082A5F8
MCCGLPGSHLPSPSPPRTPPLRPRPQQEASNTATTSTTTNGDVGGVVLEFPFTFASVENRDQNALQPSLSSLVQQLSLSFSSILDGNRRCRRCPSRHIKTLPGLNSHSLPTISCGVAAAVVVLVPPRSAGSENAVVLLIACHKRHITK